MKIKNPPMMVLLVGISFSASAVLFYAQNWYEAVHDDGVDGIDHGPSPLSSSMLATSAGGDSNATRASPDASSLSLPPSLSHSSAGLSPSEVLTLASWFFDGFGSRCSIHNLSTLLYSSTPLRSSIRSYACWFRITAPSTADSSRSSAELKARANSRVA